MTEAVQELRSELRASTADPSEPIESSPPELAGPVPKVWVRSNVDEAAVRELSVAARLPAWLARLLVTRGVRTPEAAERFLKPSLSHLPDPSTMRGLDKAVDRLIAAIDRCERIALYGDYDVDGVTSTTLLATFLEAHGVHARVYIPKRLVEGYGLNRSAVDQLADEGMKVLVTLDCGITAAGEVAHANERGIDVIVVDHHRCPPELPPAHAVLNPHQDGCAYPDKGLAAVGVCFNLVVGIRRRLRERGFYKGLVEEPNLRRLLDLVALGTIADMVPLTGVNRVLACFGLEEIREARRPGVRALLFASRVRPARTTSTDVGFRLAPRINAAGRLDDASVGVRMLLARTIAEAEPLAAVLDDANLKRQRIEAEVVEQAIARVESGPIPPAIVLYDPEWHIGVVGIVAAKIVERFGRVAVLIGEGGRGSARTAGAIHLYDAIARCEGLLRKFGGHRAAAGLTIDVDRAPELASALSASVLLDPAFGTTGGELVYDDDLMASDINDQKLRSLQALEPFGNANPEPLFRASGLTVQSNRIVGKNHLKLRLREGTFGGLEAMAFSRGELSSKLWSGRQVDLAFHLERHEYAGVESLQLRVRDLRPV
ncbi:MAG: single-stranded-DNA-specific exonuclease RecJ [Deltaproteobacteria bacterium]|nr:single-stranded-DNA-specific exonuclease RecJ [Deltaproteobacteria bacterium]